MRLADLDAKFIDFNDDGTRSDPMHAQLGRRGVGVEFLCPKCFPARSLQHEHRFTIWFTNPIDGGKAVNGVAWDRYGSTLETLSLTPSIRDVGGCKWHGYVTNGETRSAH